MRFSVWFIGLFFVSLYQPAVAQEGRPYCAEAQRVIAGTDMAAAESIHTDFEAFVKSKAFDDPLTVQRFESNPLSGEEGMTTVLSCKMKTAERINTAFPVPDGATPAAAGDGSCEAVHQRWVDELAAVIPPSERAFPLSNLVIDEEELTFIGPMWLRPWPFEPLYRGEDGRLHVSTRALYVPFSWWIPMPDRFKGTYYCHLIAPWYLEAVLRGEATPPV